MCKVFTCGLYFNCGYYSNEKHLKQIEAKNYEIQNNWKEKSSDANVIY